MLLTEYAKLWIEHRKNTVKTWAHDETRLRRHILPNVPDLPMASIGRTELENLVAHLDGQVDGNAMSWATAERVWAVVTKMFADATNSKNRALRCLETSPAKGVLGPDKGDTAEKNFLYPSDFRALMACQEIPEERRRLYAIAVYTGARFSELAALRPDCFDFVHGTVTIYEALDGQGERSSTKTGKARVVPLEPELRAFLGDPPKEIVVPSRAAEHLRTDLEKAGVTRAALFRNGPGVRHIRFHDLRATALTWMAIRGDNPLAIQRRAGHTSFETTQLYVRQAESHAAGFGQVFPKIDLAA